MIMFFVVAGMMLAVALFFVLSPLIGRKLGAAGVSHGQTTLSIYRDQLRELESDLVNGTLDQAQFDVAKLEIERRALEEYEEDQNTIATQGPRWTLATVIAVLIPLVTISAYLALGTPVALDRANVVAETAESGHDLSPQRLAAMVDRVKERVKTDPQDLDAWLMLAKTNQALGRYQDAVLAYRELVRRAPADAQLLADFADTLGVANGRSLVGEPAGLIDQALKIDPNNVKALALSGTVAFQAQDYSRAATQWRRILELVPPEADLARNIRESVADAERRAGVPVAASTAASLKPGVTLTGTVTLDQAVAKTVAPGDTVFVFARAANGPRMPLAVQRLTAKELPARFELTEAMAMTSEMSIGKFSDLLVGARISRSGSATPQAGDWESELVSARAGAQGISLTISRIVR